jgi:hypothetical protein
VSHQVTVEQVRACIHAGDARWDEAICVAVLLRRAGERPWAQAESKQGWWWLDDNAWLYLRGVVTTEALERWIALALPSSKFEVDLNTRHHDLDTRSIRFLATASVMGVKLEFVISLDEGEQPFPTHESMLRELFAPLTKAVLVRERRTLLTQIGRGEVVT